MTHTTTSPRPASGSAAPDDPRVVRALEEYAVALQRGERPDRAQFLAGLPAEVAATLAGCLDGLDLVHAAAPELSRPDGSAGVADHLPLTQPLGDYQLIREIGRGGMGVVYEAEQLSLGRRVALKVLPYAATMDPKQLQRFRHEAQAAAMLHHPHIVPVHGIGCERSVHFYAMQLIDGATLAQLIRDLYADPPSPATSAEEGVAEATGPYVPTVAATTAPFAALSTERSGAKGREYYRTLAQLIVQSADALEYAHSLGIVHRDIKPGNLMVDSAGKLWVTDFGLARFGADAGLTLSGDLLGTLRYMAPEQALARHGLVDHRADIYGLGATLYELLTGRPAADATERADILRQIAFEEPMPPRKRDRSIPAELETIALKCLTKNPADRYPTAGDLADDLRRFLDDKPIRARRIGPAARLARWARRSPVVATLTAAVFGLLAAVAVVSTIMAARIGEKADLARNEAVAAGLARDEQVKANDELRATRNHLNHTLYAAQMNLAQHAWEASNFARADELLDEVRVAASEPDLRGWEWHFLKRRLHPERFALESRSSVTIGGGPVAVAGDGSLVAAYGEDNTVKLYPTSTGREERIIGPVPTDSFGHMALSKDGKRLATMKWGSIGTLRVWDTVTGRELFSAPLPGVLPVLLRRKCFSFSLDGRRFLLARDREGSRIWDVETAKWLTIPSLPNDALTFSPDGAQVAGLSAVWDAATGQELLQLDGASKHGLAGELKYSPDGRQIAATERDDRRPSISVWDAATGRRLRTLVMPAPPDDDKVALAKRPLDTVVGSNLEYSADGRWLVAATWDGPSPVTVVVWDATTGEEVRKLTAGPRRFEKPDYNFTQSLAVSPDGARIACGDGTGVVYVWGVATSQPHRTLVGHTKTVVRLTFTSDSRSLVTVDDDGQVRVWDVTGPEDEPITLTDKSLAAGDGSARRRLLVAPDGSRVVILRTTMDRLGRAVEPNVGYDLKAFNTADGREAFTASIQTSGAYSGELMAISRDGRYLATNQVPLRQGRDGPLPESEIRVWDLAARREMSVVRRAAAWSAGRVIALSPDGTYLALGTELAADKSGVRAIDAATGREVWAVPCFAHSLAYSPDGQWLVVSTVGSDDAIKLLDAATGRQRLTISGYVSEMAFSPDCGRLAVIAKDKIEVWDTDTRQKMLTIGGIRRATDMIYSPDGRRLAVAEEAAKSSRGGKSQVKVWDAKTGRELLTVFTRLRDLHSMAFRPDGHKLIVAGLDANGKPAIEVLDGTPLTEVGAK